MSIARSSVYTGLILLYVFLAPLGNMARFGAHEGAYGITTAVLLLIAVVSLPASIQVLRRHGVFQAFALLIAWILMASVFAQMAVPALINSLTLVIYLLAAMTTFYIVRDEAAALRLITVYCLGGLLGATATIVDFAGLLDVPGVNEVAAGTATELGYVMQASGQFARRSAMATYYTIIIASGILLATMYRDISLAKRMFFFGAAMMCLIALMLTHNRAGVLGAALAVGAIIFGSANSPGRIIRMMIAAGLIVYLIAFAVTAWFPEVWTAYQARFGTAQVAPENSVVAESDALRLLFFQHALSSVFSNPVGHGYSLLTGVEGYQGLPVDPHNIVSQIIWASGLFGIAWLLAVASRAALAGFRLLRSRKKNERRTQMIFVFLGGLLAFLLVGMMHTIISTGVAWILFGALMRLASRRHKSKLSPASTSISGAPNRAPNHAYGLSQLRR